MLLGKRRRPPMKRITSMTEFTLGGDPNINPIIINNHLPRSSTAKVHRSDYTHFLTACHLCKRPLIAGRDIFMYRGDSAFCSLECRQQQMNQDKKNDKCSNKHNTPPIRMATASPNATETVVVAM